ncbi:MAG: hypothetical protein DRQ02_06460 [Candidatus Latescibacterota bacterium]|nr:MAG: hypothetical protein DRQ02_06460 [Candidatus Latescibacterota bacterium]RKY71338.1 MAG: hypothetical protein DRQ24_07605 [Candidatus Latescibacterota bacterium]
MECPGCYGSPSKYYRRSVDVPEDYSTIQAAINAAVFGQTVHVVSGTYNEQFTMKAGVDLVGAGSSNTIIDVGTGYNTAIKEILVGSEPSEVIVVCSR